MTCPRCQHENRGGAEFCAACGTPLQRPEGAQPAPSYAELQRVATEALERQTATAEILRVISSSPTDVQPVFEAIAERAMRLCHSQQGAVLTFDGEMIHIAAIDHTISGWEEIIRRAFPRQPGAGSASARAIMSRSMVHIRDVRPEPDYELPA